MRIVMRLLGPEDLSVLDHVADGVFGGPVQPQWAWVFLADSRYHMIVGVQDGIVVGMVSAVYERYRKCGGALRAVVVRDG
jgi:hypothetical protein